MFMNILTETCFFNKHFDFICSCVWSSFYRSKKLSVPASVVSRIMGRGGCNITAIQDVTGAHIDVDKQKDKNGERMITIR